MPISNILPRAPFIARNWRAHERNSLRGWCEIEVPSGIIFLDVALHQRGQDRWIATPQRSRQMPDGTTEYQPLISFRNARTRERFQDEALQAIQRMFDAEGNSSRAQEAL